MCKVSQKKKVIHRGGYFDLYIQLYTIDLQIMNKKAKNPPKRGVGFFLFVYTTLYKSHLKYPPVPTDTFYIHPA